MLHAAFTACNILLGKAKQKRKSVVSHYFIIQVRTLKQTKNRKKSKHKLNKKVQLKRKRQDTNYGQYWVANSKKASKKISKIGKLKESHKLNRTENIQKIPVRATLEERTYRSPQARQQELLKPLQKNTKTTTTTTNITVDQASMPKRCSDTHELLSQTVLIVQK